jgi:hypothetical protein
MGKNRFAATCGCGCKVAKGKGMLALVDDRWAVSCAPCAASGVAPRRPEDAAPFRRKRARTKARAGHTFKSRKTAGGRTRVAKGTRRVKTVWREAPLMDHALCFTPLRWDVTTISPRYGTVRCTPEFAQVEADLAAAQKARRKDEEMELLVTLVEMAALGHSSHAFA